MIQGETIIRVLYKDTDQMGIVYHSNYLVWFEAGRTELFRSMGTPYSDFEKNDLFLPVIKAYCEYKQPAYYDDLLKIITRVESLQGVRMLFKYEVFRDKQLLSIGNTEHAFVNRKGKPLALYKHSPFLWKRLKKVIENKDV